MHHRLAAELVHRLLEHLAEEVEADRGHVAALLGAEEIARAAQLEIERRDLESREPSSVWRSSASMRARASSVIAFGGGTMR